MSRGRITTELIFTGDAQELAEKAAELFFSIAQDSIEKRGRFMVVLSGGGTPRAVYQEIASRFSKELDWGRVFIFFGDERSVPPDHPESNYRMARESLLDKVPLGHDQIYRIPAERSPEVAAADYETELRRCFPPPADFPAFDLIFLGLGEDGHTASLFPETAALKEERRWVVANRVEKLNTDRITLTFLVINNARNVIFLVAGSSKAGALREVLEGAFRPAMYPAQFVKPKGRLIWILDRPAAVSTNFNGTNFTI